MPETDSRERLAAAIRRDVPRRPGVYSFFDARGQVIYIGKSVNLRQRMLSYFSANRASLDYRAQRMAPGIDRFEYRETPSELLALLLEDSLIKRQHPVHNVRQQKYERYLYLLLTDDEYPTCKIVDDPEVGNGTVFGPLGDQYLVADVLSVINRHFHLRWCTDAKPHRKSLNFELGYCTGPCRGQISSSAYAEIVARVVDFPRGDVDWIETKLQREMAEFAEEHAYEKAAALKNTLEFCQRFCSRQRFIDEFRTGPMSIEGSPDDGFVYEFDAGTLVSVRTSKDGTDATAPVPVDLLDQETDARFILDRANVIYGWQSRNNSKGTDTAV